MWLLWRVTAEPLWNEKKQVYARLDGTFDEDKPPIHIRHVADVPLNAHFNVVLDVRREDAYMVYYNLQLESKEGELIYPVLMRVYSDDGLLMTRYENDPTGQALNYDPVKRAANARPYKSEGVLHSSSGFNLEQGKSLTFEFEYRGKKFRTPDWAF
jgi:hypothetical protein